MRWARQGRVIDGLDCNTSEEKENKSAKKHGYSVDLRLSDVDVHIFVLCFDEKN